MKGFDKIEKIFCTVFRQKRKKVSMINKLRNAFYNLCTAFPQFLWKSLKSPLFTMTCMILLSCFVLVSCSSMKKLTGKSQPTVESSLVSMSEEEVRKKLGEPTMVSLTPDNKVLWTYRPDWKIMPDNKDTVYVEFEDGKVTKVIKAKK